MRSYLPLLLVSLAVIGCVYSQPCVSSLTLPLRISVCSAPLGTVSLQVRPNGRLQIDVNLAANVASTFREVRYSITSGNPGSDSGDYSDTDDRSFSPSGSVCGLQRRVAIAVQLRNVDGDTFIAWAVPGDVALPAGVSFTRFRNNGFAGFFTIRFCPCGPPPPTQCCNATGFTFSCGALKFCPQSSPVTGSQCYCGSIEGDGVACLADRGTCANPKECTKNSDCDAGSVCQLKSCCDNKNICVQLCGAKFPEASTCVQPPTPPTCCPAGFTFRCPSCTPAAGRTCPPQGALSTCPRTSAQATCYCANLAEGGVTCLADRGTCEGATDCTSSAQCASGSVCQRQSCCGGRSICVQKCSAKFPNSAACQATPPPPA